MSTAIPWFFSMSLSSGIDRQFEVCHYVIKCMLTPLLLWYAHSRDQAHLDLMIDSWDGCVWRWVNCKPMNRTHNTLYDYEIFIHKSNIYLNNRYIYSWFSWIMILIRHYYSQIIILFNNATNSEYYLYCVCLFLLLSQKIVCSIIMILIIFYFI